MISVKRVSSALPLRCARSLTIGDKFIGRGGDSFPKLITVFLLFFILGVSETCIQTVNFLLFNRVFTGIIPTSFSLEILGNTGSIACRGLLDAFLGLIRGWSSLGFRRSLSLCGLTSLMHFKEAFTWDARLGWATDIFCILNSQQCN